MNLPRLLTLAVALPMCLAPLRASADSFRPMPALDGGAKSLQIRWVRYDGGTNGAMVVDVKNTSTKPVTFVADGLYFVPDGSPEKAPQRLGASGPLQVISDKTVSEHVTQVALAPGQTRRVALDVFCIDSHRSSPDSETRFSVAKTRLPKQLRSELKTSNDAIYRKHRGKAAAPAAKQAVQSNMWKVRDKDWVKLEGERKREKAPVRQHRNAPNEPVQRRHR